MARGGRGAAECGDRDGGGGGGGATGRLRPGMGGMTDVLEGPVGWGTTMALTMSRGAAAGSKEPVSKCKKAGGGCKPRLRRRRGAAASCGGERLQP